MHTSSRLTENDFRIDTSDGSRRAVVLGELLCDWRPTDRLVMVSPHITDAMRGAGLLVLAVTTAYYEALRAANERFFVYPLHFTLLGLDANQPEPTPPQRQHVQAGWGNLDVWPDTNWRWTGRRAMDMLDAAVGHRANYLLWPAGFGEGVNGDITFDADRWAGVVARLCASLRSVLLYDPPRPTHVLYASQTAEDYLRGSLRSADDAPAADDRRRVGKVSMAGDALSYAQRFQRVEVGQFLDDLTRSAARRG